MNCTEYLQKNALLPEQIDGPGCLKQLLTEMELGLAGKGVIPMLPSYLSTGNSIPTRTQCCVVDAGGTNLRTALATFDAEGNCQLQGQNVIPMPGTEGELGVEELYRQIAAPLKKLGVTQRVGFCFSFNTLLERSLDGILDSWCKEVRAPEAVGQRVGASLKAQLGDPCIHVHVLNDSVAALLWAAAMSPGIKIGLILGTGINVCYPERCANTPKVPRDLTKESMIISTEVGEFQKIPKTTFDAQVIARSDDPATAHAEKQCSGAYLGQLISLAWQQAAREGLLPEVFSGADWELSQISRYLEKPDNPTAAEIAAAMICRAAKIAAILTAGSIVRCASAGEKIGIAVEGSQFQKLTGFREAFLRELDALLAPYGIGFEIFQFENSCLKGAALAAFAEPM